jgi:hypothetical protein
MFLVLVTHNTSHGEATSPILITQYIRHALIAARRPERFGYELFGTEIGATIYNLELDKFYAKSDFTWNLPPPPSTMVFSRKHCKTHEGAHLTDGSCWEEEWFDPILKEVFKEVSV